MQNPVRRLYHWVLQWAVHPAGEKALFLLALAEASFFPIPPDVLLVALSVGKPKKALRFALICLVGSVLGGLVGYGIGYLFWQSLSHVFFSYVPGFSPALFEKVTGLYHEHAGWAVFIAGFTPIPYKVFTVAGGISQIPLLVFFIASVLSRGLRFFLVAGLIAIFGEKVSVLIEKYFNLLTILLMVLLVGGFYFLKVATH